jgi:4-hydroxy-2-oxoheptanedioate aldolase
MHFGALRMNRFIESLSHGTPKIGLWQSLANNYTAEISAGTGYEWLLFDGEHSPNTLQTLLSILQAMAAFPHVEPIARVPVGEAAVIKQYLDIGFRTLLVPMVDSAEQARHIVAAMRFPPAGLRGVASSTSRASGFGADAGYLREANSRVGLIVQIESTAALAALEDIAAVEGVDALFIGPADLAGSMGHLGTPKDPSVQAAIEDALRRIIACGKPAGIFALDVEDGLQRIAQGVKFLSVGTDIGLLRQGALSLRRRFS